MVDDNEVSTAASVNSSRIWNLSHNLCYREHKEYAVFRELLRMVSGLETRLMELSEEQVVDITDLVRWTPTTCRVLWNTLADPERRKWC